jgi:hypothetical protein
MNNLRNFIRNTVRNCLNEQTINSLVLYRGEEKEWLKPTDNEYSFFAKDKSFAEDYGDYIWKCTFKPLKLFISYNKESIIELYDNGFKLRDNYIEDNWNKKGTSYDVSADLYDYDENGNFDDWGYKSAQHVIASPYFDGDTWEIIEHTNGVLDYILSKYDGVALLEGGKVTYYLRTDKIINCELENK